MLKTTPRDVVLNYDPAQWWREVGKQLFPTLYKVAMSRLPCRPASAEGERDNSAGGRMLSPLRCKTSGWKFEVLLWCHLNFELLPEDFEILPYEGAGKYRPRLEGGL